MALSPGQQLVAEGGKAWVRAVDPAQVEAWEQGRVVFDDETLPAAVAKMSRYAHRRWRVDPALDTVKISGAFDIDEPDAFIDTVENYLHISATVTAGGVTVLSAPTVPTKK